MGGDLPGLDSVRSVPFASPLNDTYLYITPHLRLTTEDGRSSIVAPVPSKYGARPHNNLFEPRKYRALQRVG